MKIAKSKKKSEFELQAEAMILLKASLGDSYIVRGEYVYRRCRFDLAIFRVADRELICTIEIKPRGGMKKHHKQINRYHRATGKPCVLLNEDNMYAAIAALKAHFAGAPTDEEKCVPRLWKSRLVLEGY
jgi:hypothetical protein